MSVTAGRCVGVRCHSLLHVASSTHIKALCLNHKCSMLIKITHFVRSCFIMENGHLGVFQSGLISQVVSHGGGGVRKKGSLYKKKP